MPAGTVQFFKPPFVMCRHPLWSIRPRAATRLLVELIASASGEAATNKETNKNGSSTCAPDTQVGDTDGTLALGFGLSQT